MDFVIGNKYAQAKKSNGCHAKGYLIKLPTLYVWIKKFSWLTTHLNEHIFHLQAVYEKRERTLQAVP